MSWLFSQALEAAYSAASRSDGAQSAPLNATPTLKAYYWPDRTTEHSRLSRFGMTCEPLMAIPGEALLMWYRGGFRARTLAPPVPGPVLTVSKADYGSKWPGSFAKYDHDLRLWKTPQCSLFEDLDEYSATWPQWGVMRNGACWERITPALCTSAKECGFWPTVRATDGERGGRGDLLQALRANPSRRYRTRPGQAAPAGSRGQLNPDWLDWLMGWPIGWSALEPLEMARFQEWQQQHGEYSKPVKVA